ncbi:hypothetical protein G3N95_12420 [Paraburkholderia sp. Tr-20389]|uniref:hypothetical protein n=1 Tax=Paraburkholderia sp. Tr-20389 TaxID=2703903 RepID=UPI00197F56A5|nr:hypothetical protein [Paraburkholderia sp. Tr-20389]MBN3753747.1 hypothetical protein [Paraburkholderia sp. Tr-20389]
MSLSFPKRYTTFRVVVCTMMLQSLHSLQLFSYLGFLYSHSWSTFKAAMPSQLLMCEAVWLASTITSLVASIALFDRRKWGRTLYVWTLIANHAIGLLTPFRLFSLISLPFSGALIAILYSRQSRDFLEEHRTPRERSLRDCIRIGALAVSCSLHYLAMSFSVSRTGWLAMLMPNGRPLDLLVVAAVALVIGLALSQQGRRAWNCGVTLMVFSVSMTGQLIVNVATSTPLVRYLPPPFRFIAYPWSVMIPYTGMVALVAFTLLQSNRPHTPGPALKMPDFT